MDLCEKTNVLSESIDLKKSRCFTLTCTVHVISGTFGGAVQLWEVMEDRSVRSAPTATAGNTRQVRCEAGEGDIERGKSPYHVWWLHSKFNEKGLLLIKSQTNLNSFFVKKKFLRNECNQQRCQLILIHTFECLLLCLSRVQIFRV